MNVQTSNLKIIHSKIQNDIKIISEGEAVSEEDNSGDEEDLELLKEEGGDDIKTTGKRKRKKKPDILQRYTLVHV